MFLKRLNLIVLLQLLHLLLISGLHSEHFGFMEKLFRKCNSPSKIIDSKSPILAKAILPTMTMSKHNFISLEVSFIFPH